MITVKELQVVYKRTGIKAVKNINLEITDGMILGILGPNGAGKTTLLKAIAGILPYNGMICIDGIELSRIPHKVLARIISFMGDISVPEALSLTVYEALLTARYPVSRGFFETKEDARVIDGIVERLDIKHLLNRRLSELSSGELRMVAIAMALAKEPRYILLDEPDAHLDLYNKVKVSKIIREAGKGRTIIFTTHDIYFAINTATHLVILRNGEIIGFGEVNEVLDKGLLEKAYGTRFMMLENNGFKIPVPLYK